MSDVSPVTFGEIESWSNITGTPITSWEALAIRNLSESFISEYNDAKSPAKQPPWMPHEVDREAIAKGFSAALSAAANRGR